MVRQLWRALGVALIALLLVVQPMFAAAPEPLAARVERHYGLACVDGVCRAQLDLGFATDALPSAFTEGAWLTFMQGALRQLPGGAGIEVQDDVTITLPTGSLSLVDADLVLTLDDAGQIATLRGSAAAPVPTFGLLGDLQVVTPARVAVGYDRGDALTALDAPLEAARRYFFIDAEAGLHLLTHGLDLRADQGQRATLIVDFAQPMVYVDGQLTLYTDGQMAFIREALGPIGDSQWMPTDLPLRQSVVVHLQGQMGRAIEPQLTLGGEYRMDGGLMGKWMQIDATPLLARGQAIISPAGLMLEGNARSALQPGKWFDGGAQAQLFVPFDDPETTALTVGADVASPMMGVEQAATATMAGESGWMARTGEMAWGGVQQGWQQVVPAMQSGYGWVSNGVSEGIGTGWANTQQQWCGLTGFCAEPTAVIGDTGSDTAVRVAEAK